MYQTHIRVVFAAAVMSVGVASLPGQTTTIPPAAETRIRIEPGDPFVAPGRTVHFKAHSSNSDEKEFTWSVSGGPGNGSIDAVSGVYTAPDLIPKHPPKVTAKASADPAHAGSTSVTITNSPPPMWIEPRDAFVLTGGVLQLKVHATEPADEKVKWKIIGDKSYGKVDKYSGVYTAPDSVPGGPATVAATAIGNKDHTASVSITINASSCPPDQLQKATSCLGLRPPSQMLRVNDSVVLTATRVNVGDAPLNWSIQVGGNDTRGGGRLEGSGNSRTYIAPPEVPSGQVTVLVKVPVPGRKDPVSTSATMFVVARYASAHCSWTDESRSAGCKVIKFNRIKGERGAFTFRDAGGRLVRRPVTDATPALWIQAVSSAKALTTGSVLEVKYPSGVTASNCKNYDWKVVTQAEESPSVLIYNPGDIGAGICTQTEFLIGLPVRALWADISAFPQLKDPQRSPPASASSFSDCWGQNTAQTISPCDRYDKDMRIPYKLAWLATRFGQAGAAQGSIGVTSPIGSRTPNNNATTLSFDLQADPGLRALGGWLNTPFTFEKNGNFSSNFDSLIFGLAYDIRALKNPNLARYAHFMLRKPQAELQSGWEFAPTTPHDENWISSGTVKLPVVFNFHNQPSAFTAYPVIGVEGGSHIAAHLVEHDSILREVVGVDGSFRWPYNTHNFLGGSPITLQYSYRMRWLAYAEPTTDVAHGGAETVATGRHSYLRAGIGVPLTPNLQFSITEQHGALPPDFRVLGNTLSIGLTFTNPGSSEH